MSSFSDNFKRDSSAEEEMLEYDDGAFYYFSISVLSFVLIPITWSILSKLIWGEIQISSFKGGCKCSHCSALLYAKKREARASVFTGSFYFRLMSAAFLWYIWYINANVVSQIESLQAFDPFQILEISSDATVRDIKKQYRKMSLEKHPDRNPDNPLAVQEFIRLTKAYNILTDETAYDNFKKYGNPDGPGSYNVAIALPRFLLEKENQIPVLFCAFFILLVIIPGFLYLNFGDTSTKDENGILIQNKVIYAQKINTNMLPKHIPMILALSHECQAIGAKDLKTEQPLLKKLRQNEYIDEMLPKTQSRVVQSMNWKPLLLILGYINQDENVRHPIFKEGLAEILRKGVFHLQMMIDLCMEINARARQTGGHKTLGWKCISSIIEFQQFFVQGIWTEQDPLEQLPGFTPAVVKAYRKQLKTYQIPDGRIETFCRLTPEQRAKLDLFKGDEAKQAQLEKVVQTMPLVSVSSKVECEGEKVITETDIVTFRITIKYDQLEKEVGPGYVCSRNYNFLKRSNWYVCIVDANTKEQLIAIERLATKEDSNEVVYEMKQRLGRAGTFAFHAFIRNDSYLGFDKEVSLEANIVKEDPDRVVEEYSKEDKDAVKGPGLVQQMMMGEEEDSEDSDDNMENLAKKLEEAGLKAPTAGGKKVGTELVESD